jgi:hypothetical protein
MQKATNLWRICLSTLLFVALGLGSKEFLTHFKPITVSANSHNYQFQNVVIGGAVASYPGLSSARVSRTLFMRAPTSEARIAGIPQPAAGFHCWIGSDPMTGT